MAEANKVKLKSANRPAKVIGPEEQTGRLVLYKLCVCSLMLTRVSVGCRSGSRPQVRARKCTFPSCACVLRRFLFWNGVSVSARASPRRIALACARRRRVDCAVLGAPYLGDVMPWRALQQNLRSREGVSYLRKSCGTTRCPRSRPELVRGRCPADERTAFSFSLLFLLKANDKKIIIDGNNFLYIENPKKKKKIINRVSFVSLD